MDKYSTYLKARSIIDTSTLSQHLAAAEAFVGLFKRMYDPKGKNWMHELLQENLKTKKHLLDT